MLLNERDSETVLNALLIAAGMLAQDAGTLHHSPDVQAAARQGREVFEDLAARMVLYRKLRPGFPGKSYLSDALVETLAMEWEQLATVPKSSNGVQPSHLGKSARRCALTARALRELLAARVLVGWVARDGCGREITSLARAMMGETPCEQPSRM